MQRHFRRYLGKLPPIRYFIYNWYNELEIRGIFVKDKVRRSHQYPNINLSMFILITYASHRISVS